MQKLAQSVSIKLQLCIDEMNRSLEETSSQVRHQLPRILSDIDAIDSQLSLLHTQMQSIQSDVDRVDHSNMQDELIRYDAIKQRLEKVVGVLKQSNQWTQLCADINDVFLSGNVDTIYARLAVLAAISATNKNAERKEYMDRLLDQFAATISPAIVHALNERDAGRDEMDFVTFAPENVVYLAQMLCRLGRVDALNDYYRLCLKVSRDLSK